MERKVGMWMQLLKNIIIIFIINMGLAILFRLFDF